MFGVTATPLTSSLLEYAGQTMRCLLQSTTDHVVNPLLGPNWPLQPELMVYGPQVRPLVDAWLAGEPVTTYVQLVTGAVCVSMPKEMVQEVSPALQDLVKAVIFHWGISAIADTASDRASTGAATVLLAAATRPRNTVLKCMATDEYEGLIYGIKTLTR